MATTMRVAVTGGAGYIGSIVTENLVASGHEVMVIDDLSKGHRDTVPPEAQFAELSLLDRPALTAALSRFSADAVIHMAASSLVGESVGSAGKYYENNFNAGLTLLEAMRASGMVRLVFSSTAAVYGEPAKQPIEEGDPTKATNPSGETKLAFERALYGYAGAHGLSSVSLRYFNAAGASARNGERHNPETHLIPLVLRVAAGQLSHVTVFGDDYPTRDGTCVRDYIHVEDLAAAHVLALDGLQERGLCAAYNLGCGGEGYSVKEIIDAAQRLTGGNEVGAAARRRPRRADREFRSNHARPGLATATAAGRHRNVGLDVDDGASGERLRLLSVAHRHVSAMRIFAGIRSEVNGWPTPDIGSTGPFCRRPSTTRSRPAAILEM